MPRLSVSLLGTLRATKDGSPVGNFDTDKTRALLAYICADSRRAHQRDTLAGLLWPEQPEDAARRSLRQALYKLRQILGEEGSSSFLLITPQSVQLDPGSDYDVDVETFTELLATCQAHRHRKIEFCSTCHSRLRQAAELYGGDFLEGFFLENSQAFEEWLVLKREGLRRQAVEVFSRLTTYYETRGEFALALEHTYRLLEIEPWHEDAHRHAMRLLTLTGQRNSGLTHYAKFKHALFEELGVEPERETTELYGHIRSGDQGSGIRGQKLIPDPRSLIPSSKHNLPAQTAPFIGREAEMRLLVERLDSPDHRLLTLIGPGGVGKTRLAWQVAREQVDAFDDGVYWVALAAIAAPDASELLPSSIAQAIGFRFEKVENPAAQILDYLRDKEMLLVLVERRKQIDD